MTNFGAMDLSASGANPAGETVTSWLVKADEPTLRRYLALSEKLPVIMLISDSSEASARVRKALTEIIASGEGRLVGIDVDLETSPQLAAAVAVNQAPAALAILAGQPAPIFKGEATMQQMAEILSQVLQAAAQNGLTGKVSLGAAPEAQKPVPPEFIAAYEAIDRGDLDSAEAIFSKYLVEKPADQDAKAGLAQVKLMKRLQSPEPGEQGALFASADQLLVGGDPAAAFKVLLDEFAVNFDARDQIRTRLLELFTLIGDSEEPVLAARRRLASLLF